jgi:Ornithine cyclodeaminase/mu-crystallin family
MKDHMPTDKLLFLDEEQVKAVLSCDELIPAIEGEGTAEMESAAGRGDRQDGGPVVFKSVGIAIEDIAAAKLVYDRVSGRLG